MITKPPSNQGSRLGTHGISQGVNMNGTGGINTNTNIQTMPKKTLIGFRI